MVLLRGEVVVLRVMRSRSHIARLQRSQVSDTGMQVKTVAMLEMMVEHLQIVGAASDHSKLSSLGHESLCLPLLWVEDTLNGALVAYCSSLGCGLMGNANRAHSAAVVEYAGCSIPPDYCTRLIAEVQTTPAPPSG